MKILFVCSGNTCRSPMAEAIARRLAEERGLADVEVSSAGTGAMGGAPISDGALLVGIENGMDLGAHRSRPLDRELVEEADLILVMGAGHLERAEALGGQGRSFLLADYASGGLRPRAISDPYGSGLDVYRATFAELTEEVGRALDRIRAERSGK